jgi:hypothetical protein
METSESGTPSPPSTPGPRRRGRRLGTIANVKAGLGAVIRGLEAGAPADGTLDPKRATCLVYAYATLASVIKGSELEDRIAALETVLAARGGPPARVTQ